MASLERGFIFPPSTAQRHQTMYQTFFAIVVQKSVKRLCYRRFLLRAITQILHNVDIALRRELRKTMSQSACCVYTMLQQLSCNTHAILGVHCRAWMRLTFVYHSGR